MRDEIVVAVVDTGIDYSSFDTRKRSWLYRNDAEVAGNGRDDDGNGLVDDVTGPSSGPASNGGYQAVEGSKHGHGMTLNVIRQLEAAEDALGSPLSVSIMPVSMYTGGYYANIVAAAKAGASVISLSHNLSYSQKAHVSKLLAPYDAIAVTVGRDLPGDHNPDAGEGPGRPFDNVIEVAMISEAITRGNVHVDLLEVGSSVHNRSESHAIANAAGKLAAIWGVDPTRSPAEVLQIAEAATTLDHDTIRSKGLSSEMGGRIDLGTAVALARGPVDGDGEVGSVKGERQARELNEVDATGGYFRASGGDDLISLGDDRAIVFGGGGEDVFVFSRCPDREHVLRDFEDGDMLDLGALVDGDADRVRLQEASWNGETHTRVLVDEDGAWTRVAVLNGVEDVTMDAFLL